MTEGVARPVVVLGMHKSGTTLIAETLHASGIEMVDQQVASGYDDGNKFERLACRAINDSLLGCSGHVSTRVLRVLCDEASQALGERLIAEMMNAIEPSCRPWGFKDPRTLLAYDVWARNLGSHSIVGVYRSPITVFKHYWRSMRLRGLVLDPQHLVRAVYAWTVYNDRLVSIVSNAPHSILIDYDRFMEGEEDLKALGSYLGVPMVDRRNPALRRSQTDRSVLYEVCRRLAERVYGADVDATLARLNEAARVSRYAWRSRVLCGALE